MSDEFDLGPCCGCDVCQQKIDDTTIDTVLKHACAGYPAKDGRVPYADLKGVHRHDMSFHPGEE